MANPKPATRFKLKGPVFQTNTQISLGFQEAVNRGLLDLALLEGANKVKEQLYGNAKDRHGRIKGDLRNHIGANLIKDNVAQIDAGEFRYGANLIYSAWVEGIGSRNSSSGFSGYQMFENTYEHINNNPKLYEDYIAESIVEAFD